MYMYMINLVHVHVHAYLARCCVHTYTLSWPGITIMIYGLGLKWTSSLP